MQKNLPSNWLGRWLLGAGLLLLASGSAQAQLAGTKTIPGSYPSLAAAIADLNTQGVGAGGVTFNVAAGYVETAANLLVTATGTAANPIVFQKAGSGANPLLTAGVGTSTGLDYVIGLAGADYVTFSGLDVAESAANTTATTQMEFGYALFRPSATDGCQNNTIRNCVVTLTKANANTIGIAGLAGTALSTTSVAATATSGANSGNKIYGNVVTNALTGINFAASSSTTVANYDQNNEIGSAAAGTANTIGNFGGSASGWGAGGSYQNGLRIIGNTINSTLNYTSATASTSVAASTVTSTLRGIYANTGTSSSLDITGNALTLASGATTSALYGLENTMGSTPAGNTVNITSNTLVLSYATATTGLVYGLNNSGSPATLNITGNTISSINQTGTGALYGIYNNHAATAANVLNNTVGGVTRPGASGSVYGYYNNGSGSGTHTLTGNTFSNFTLSTSGTFYGIYNTSAAAETQLYSANQIANVTSSAATILYGIYCTYGASGSQVFNNTVANLSSAGTTAGGIYLSNSSFSGVAAYGNVVGSLSLSGTAGVIYGLYTSVTTASLYRNKVYDLSCTGSGASVVYGLYTAGGTTITAYNNLLGNLTAPASTSLGAVNGLYFSAGTTVNAYYNTIYLSASSSGATFGTSGIYFSSTPTTVDVRNNVVVNLSTAAGTGGYSVALRRSTGTAGTVPANYAPTSNNNLLYAGTPSATSLLYVEGTTTATNAQQTLAAYKAFMVSRDQAAVTENPPFASTTGSAATFLHISSATPTQVESGGAPIAGITTDYDGDPRNATTPDIGADEGTFTPNDQTPPTIAYTPLGNTGSTASRTLAVTITDGSGVATGAGAPRLYYRAGTSGTYYSAPATTVSGSTYTFTIDYANLGGPPAAGTTIQYYVAAQDASANANVATSPVGGAGSNPPGSTAPATPNSYQVLLSLSGTYYVTASGGSSPAPTREYATLTAALNAYNTSGLAGAVSFVLLDASYSSAETFPLVLNANGDASATNTLTIRPGAGVTATIAGSVATGAVLKLNGADYVTIDGSNAGTTSQNLTLTNTSATGSGNAVLWLAAASATDGATNNVVKNTAITGNSGAGFPQFTVFVGGGGAGVTAPTTSTPASNSNNTLSNNVITRGYYGVFVFGVSATALDQGNAFTGNQIGQAASGTGFGQEGLRAVYQQGLSVTGNDIQNLTSSTATSNLYGIFLADSKGAVISRNAVHGLSYSGTSTTKVWAINTSISAFVTAANPSANRLDNNLVYGINSMATSGTWNTVGLNLGGGYGDQIVYNTVYLSGQLSAAGGTAGSAAFANGNPSVTAVATNLDVRNNIFSIIGGTGGTTATPLYAHYEYGSTVAGSTLNYNDLYAMAGATGLAVVGRLNSTDYATLAAWRTATGQEANSVSADPQFTQTATAPYNLTPTAAALNNVGTPISGVTTDYAGTARSSTPDIGALEFTPPACQPATALAITGITATTATLTFTAPAGAAASGYTITYTPQGGAAVTVTPSPTGSPVSLTNLTASTTYVVAITTTCAGATSPAATVSFTTACTPPVYAALPVAEGFENTWLSRCDVREAPSASWVNTPATGNPSWRRDDDGPAAGWTLPTGGAFTPAGSQGSSHAARFHSYYVTAGVTGTLDLYADLSAAGPKRLTFDYVNVSTGGSKLDVLLSTDGGATFAATPLLTLTTATAFAAQTLDLTATSATSVIRFRATGDYGSYDLGLDNVQLRVVPAVDVAATSLATPTATQGCYGSAETVSVVVTNAGSQALNFAANPATVTAVVTTPGGSQMLTGTVSTGTLAVGATQTVTLTPTLDMTAVGTYSFALTATASGDQNPTNDALTPAPTRTVAAPVAGTLSPAAASICVSGTATLTLAGAANGSIQYQRSTDGTTFTDIAGATAAAYTTPVLTSTTYFRAQVRCGTSTATSNVATITVNNPQIASTNGPIAICAGSPATLTATPAAGSSVRFFDVATGGTTLATTTPGSYTTPALTASATYYAEAYSGGTEAVGKATSNQTNGGYSGTGTGLVFTTTGALTLQAATVYNATATAGSLSVDLVNNATGAVIATAGPFAIPAGSTSALLPTVLPLNLAVPAAGTYRLVTSSTPTPPTLYRDSGTNNSFPYTSPSGAITITSGYIGGTSTSYYFFYNIQASTECVGGAARTPIQVNVTQPATASFPATTAATCGSTGYQLAGTVGGSATTGTYASSGTGTFSPNAATLGATYLPSAADIAAGSVSITLSTAATGGCPAATATLTLSISPAPVATFSYPASTTYCAGAASTVMPTLAAGATAGTFSSTTGLSLNATTGVITLSSSVAGTYTITNTVAASGPCAATSATTTVTIAPATSAGFSYASATYCVSGATNPVATVTGTAGGTFSAPAGLSLNPTTGAITLASSTPGTYSVTYTVAGPCGSSATQSVTITAPATASFSYPGTSTCAGTTGTVVPTLPNGSQAGTFTASPAGLSLNAATGVITFSTSAVGNYTITNTIAASSGCAAVSSSTTFAVLPQTTATFSYASATYCVSGSTNPVPTVTGTAGGTFTAGGTGAPSGLALNATTGAITLSASTPGTYTVTYTVSGACGSSATQTVTITAAPLASFSYPAMGGNCAGSTGTVAATLGTGATAGTFSSTPGLTLNASTGAVNLATSVAGTYIVTNTVAASGNCAAVTATATLTVNPTPATPTLTATGTAASGITLTSSAGTGNQFYLNGVLIPGATAQTYLVNSGTRNGQYTVVTTSAAGCSSAASAAVNVTVTATAATQAATALRVYPNPTPNGQVTLELSGARGATQLTVLDAVGRVVLSQQLPASTGTVTHALDLSGAATGVYLLRLSSPDGVEVRRLTRE